jgi:hypothetical protein
MGIGVKVSLVLLGRYHKSVILFVESTGEQGWLYNPGRYDHIIVCSYI